MKAIWIYFEAFQSLELTNIMIPQDESIHLELSKLITCSLLNAMLSSDDGD